MTDDLLDRILREIRERLEASRDAYEESRRLDAALAALGAPASSSPAPARTSRSQRGRPASPRAPRGENLRRIREVVGERPGTSAGEIASATGIARSTVASTLAKLARDGELERTEVPSGRVGYRAAREKPAADAPAPSAPASPSSVHDAPAPEPEPTGSPAERPGASGRRVPKGKAREPRGQSGAPKPARAAERKNGRKKTAPDPPEPAPTEEPRSDTTADAESSS